MIKFLQDLIQIESLSPRDEGCFDIIEDRLNKLNFNCERINYLNVENLYATFGDKGKLFCFLGHTDVVPTGPVEKWTYPPFSAHIEGKRFFNWTRSSRHERKCCCLCDGNRRFYS